MPRGTTKPELMSPAGYWPQLQTAIEAGADAVYFGLNHFSARAKVGFDLEELPEVMETLHARGVKGFVTFNTLVFDHELEQAESTIIAIANCGVDAVIVQDVGIAKLVRRIAPELDIHGSTQMSITSAQGAELAKSQGCSRVVLGRELSVDDIRKVAEATDVELEVFVHGALCVSYSGQCFSSEAWGGRSANRGKCAQACRLSYDLIVDGQPRDLGEYRYLISPGDLYAIEQIPELVELGVSCFKIEGRYKDSDYVALTTRAYREAIDLAWLKIENEDAARDRVELEQVYSRGLGAHFIGGINHQTVVEGRAPRHRGLQVGVVTAVSRRAIEVESSRPIKPGDGLVFDAADWRSPDEPEEGGHVYEVTPRAGNIVSLAFEHDKLDADRIRPGDRVWRTHDPQLKKQLKPLTRTEVPVFTRPISFSVTATGGQPIEIEASLESGLTGVFVGEHPLAPAQKRALDEELLAEKLGRLGGTPFHLGGIELTTSDHVFVPTSLLNQARRELVDALFEAAGEVKPIVASPALPEVLSEINTKRTSRNQASSNQASSNDRPADAVAGATAQLHLLVRTAEQLEGAIDAAELLRESLGKSGSAVTVASITLDYLELYGLRPSVERIREAGLRPRVASPRILKPSEQKVNRFLWSLECDILVRSGGLLYDLVREPDFMPASAVGAAIEQQASATIESKLIERKLIGDFSLNAANAISAWEYLDLGLSAITPTYDLNAQQIAELTAAVPAAAIEVIAYSHLPVFHTEHCVFCRFLSDGTDHTNCGHPCESHQVSVRDSQGRAHPVMADVGCRNTIFGAEAQTNPAAILDWQACGIEQFRLEFVHQSKQQVAEIVAAFAQFFASGETSAATSTSTTTAASASEAQIPAPVLSRSTVAAELSANLQAISPQGTTEGSLFVPQDFKNLVQLG